MKDTSMPSEQESPVHHAHDREEVNLVDEAMTQMVILVKILIIQLMQRI
jgi:hypothetical protein